MTSPASFVLALTCGNRPGIVAAVSTRLYELNYNILDAQQFDDVETNKFFMRIVFNSVDPATRRTVSDLKNHLGGIAERFQMIWSLRREDERQRVMLLVSKFDHCLNDLLYRWQIGELRMDISGAAVAVRGHLRRPHCPTPPAPSRRDCPGDG